MWEIIAIILGVVVVGCIAGALGGFDWFIHQFWK